MVMKVYESAKILTIVQTFRDCALHQWSVRYEFPGVEFKFQKLRFARARELQMK